MWGFDPFLGVAIGVALSAAAGFRVFVPLLLTSLAARFGAVTLTPGMTWVGSEVALIAFATATVVEVLAYYVPWLDNLLDSIAMPAAIAAGVITTASVTPDLPPLLRGTLAIIAGGGAAGLVQAGTALLRLTSSGLTGGIGNPVVATGELVGAVVLSLLGLIAPLIALVAVAFLLIVVMRRARKFVRHRRRSTLQT